VHLDGPTSLEGELRAAVEQEVHGLVSLIPSASRSNATSRTCRIAAGMSVDTRELKSSSFHGIRTTEELPRAPSSRPL